MNPKCRLGYACINISLKDRKICPNRTCRLATLQSQFAAGGSDGVYTFLTNLSKNNLNHLKIIIQWHVDNKLYFYRMSSDMFPHISQPELTNLLSPEQRIKYQSLEFAKDQIGAIGILAYRHNIRLTMHPGQFNQLGSPTPSVVDKTIQDLTWQCQLLDLMEQAVNLEFNVTDSMKDSILCIHGGGTYGDKPAALQRWTTTFQTLSPAIRRRIALENCEKAYCVEDLLPICNDLKIPLIFDFHHYQCWNHYHQTEQQRSITDILPDILKTWEQRGLRPKFHLSDQAPGKMIGAHADYVEKIPDELFGLMATGYEFDIMIEAKQKDLAVFRLLEKYAEKKKFIIRLKTATAPQ